MFSRAIVKNSVDMKWRYLIQLIFGEWEHQNNLSNPIKRNYKNYRPRENNINYSVVCAVGHFTIVFRVFYSILFHQRKLSVLLNSRINTVLYNYRKLSLFFH